MIDPLFKQTTMKFDDTHLGNLMGSTLNVNSDLLLQLDSEMINVLKKKSGSSEAEPDQMEDANISPEMKTEYKSILAKKFTTLKPVFTDQNAQQSQSNDPLI